MNGEKYIDVNNGIFSYPKVVPYYHNNKKHTSII